MILEAERAEQQQQHTPHITNYAKQLTTPNNQDRCCHLYSLASEKTANKKGGISLSLNGWFRRCLASHWMLCVVSCLSLVASCGVSSLIG